MSPVFPRFPPGTVSVPPNATFCFFQPLGSMATNIRWDPAISEKYTSNVFRVGQISPEVYRRVFQKPQKRFYGLTLIFSVSSDRPQQTKDGYRTSIVRQLSLSHRTGKVETNSVILFCRPSRRDSGIKVVAWKCLPVPTTRCKICDAGFVGKRQR
jgi:hypothetical protein